MSLAQPCDTTGRIVPVSAVVMPGPPLTLTLPRKGLTTRHTSRVVPGPDLAGETRRAGGRQRIGSTVGRRFTMISDVLWQSGHRPAQGGPPHRPAPSRTGPGRSGSLGAGSPGSLGAGSSGSLDAGHRVRSAQAPGSLGAGRRPGSGARAARSRTEPHETCTLGFARRGASGPPGAPAMTGGRAKGATRPHGAAPLRTELARSGSLGAGGRRPSPDLPSPARPRWRAARAATPWKERVGSSTRKAGGDRRRADAREKGMSCYGRAGG